MVAIADLDVHAVEARHQSRYHQHDRDAGHLFHYVVDVVADDRLEGIEHSGKDLGVDLHCVRRLAKLDFDILEQVGVIALVVDVSHPAEKHLVSLDRRVEVDKSVLGVTFPSFTSHLL